MIKPLSWSWRNVWRAGIGPSLSQSGLEALRDALIDESDELIGGQGTFTTVPEFVIGLNNDGVRPEAACAIGYCGWRGEGLQTVEQVEGYFLELCGAAVNLLGADAGSIQPFVTWWDDTPLEQTRPELLAEVERELCARAVRRQPCYASS